MDEAGFPSQVFTDTFFDIFVFSHFIGWFGFALIMRDVCVSQRQICDKIVTKLCLLKEVAVLP